MSLYVCFLSPFSPFASRQCQPGLFSALASSVRRRQSDWRPRRDRPHKQPGAGMPLAAASFCGSLRAPQLAPARTWRSAREDIISCWKSQSYRAGRTATSEDDLWAPIRGPATGRSGARPRSLCRRRRGRSSARRKRPHVMEAKQSQVLRCRSAGAARRRRQSGDFLYPSAAQNPNPRRLRDRFYPSFVSASARPRRLSDLGRAGGCGRGRAGRAGAGEHWWAGLGAGRGGGS